MEAKLFGIGVGPGDPELMTIKAKRILNEVDIIFTPVSRENKKSRALEIIEDIIDYEDRIKKLVFPMSADQTKKKKYWKRNTQIIIGKLKENKKLAFITIGDPLFYGTYNYILKNIKKENTEEIGPFDNLIETIPGVTSINASTARLNLPLTCGDEKLIILPGIPDIKEIEDILADFENVVILKLSRNYKQFINFLKDSGYENKFAFISKCNYTEEFITTDLAELEEREIDYLSLMILKNEIGEIHHV